MHDYFRTCPSTQAHTKCLISLRFMQQKGSGQTGAFNKNQKETVTKYYLK